MDVNLAVHVENVTKAYGSTTILKKMNMHVEQGTIYGLLGSSGCGKTTILGCIVGRKKYEQGQITLFGEKNVGVPGNIVGYMPQETALVDEFTVKDTIFFFGRIYNIPQKVLEEKYQQLKKLLELPPSDRLIEDCSGGEKRRVSFAVALIHEPKLLILDEPSVGVDPILRERIWNYLFEITAKREVTVILTTHYLDEAKEAQKVGFLTRGTLMVEENPKKLITAYDCGTLENVFFKLCRSQNKASEITENATYTNEPINVKENSDSTGHVTSFEVCEVSSRNSKAKTRRKNKLVTNFAFYRLNALLFKNIKQILGNKFGFFVLLTLPFVELWLIFLAVGRHINDIPLGIVNDEIHPKDCLGVNVTVRGDEYQCHLNKISCRFLDYLDNPVIFKKYYNDFPTAINAAKRGELTGVVYINKNLSTLMEHRINDHPLVQYNELIETEIDVYLDMSNVQIGGEVKHTLIQLYNNFFESIFSECGISPKAGKLPINIVEKMFDIERDPYVVFLTPGLSLTLVFFIGMILTSFTIVMEKSIGIWDRTIIAGVTSLELVVSHLIIQSIEMLLITLSLFISIYLIFREDIAGSLFDMFLLIYLQGFVGLFFGFFISSFSSSYTMVNVIVTSIMNPAVLFSGVIWPTQAMSEYLQYLSKATPLTLSTESFRQVMRKGTSLMTPELMLGIGVPVLWTAILGIISIYIVKFQR